MRFLGRVLTACALLAAGLPSAALAQERPDPEALVAMLRAGKIAELDARVGAYQAAYEASTENERDLVIVFAGFERVDPELEAAFDAWVKARPRSYGALVARAAYFYRRAWSARGGNYTAKTQKVRMEAMQRLFASAARDFATAVGLSSRPQLAHRYLIVIAMALGDRAAVRRWYEAALKADPENYASRRAYLNALRPEWGGSVKAMQAFVNETAASAATPKMRAVAQSLKASAIGHRARDAQRSKKLDDALSFYKEGLAEAEDASLLADRGQTLLEMKRLDEALRDFNRALELDPTSEDALERRGNLYERRKQMKEALHDYTRAASYGSAFAMQRLGILYITGKDVPRNYPEAAKWLHLGADLGDHRAQAYLGWMYSEGAGVPQDGKRAVALWRLSAEQGNEQAQKYLERVPWLVRARFAVEEFFSRLF